MNGLQRLTIPTSLKFCLALCFSSGPNSSKFGPSCPQVGPNFFHLAKDMAVFPVKFQLRGFVPLTPEKWGYKEKIGVQNKTSMDTKLLKSH